MLRLLDRARVLLVEDAMRFAVGLYVATHTPRTVDQREKIRTQCEVGRAGKAEGDVDESCLYLTFITSMVIGSMIGCRC